jgi:hypothetical protein
VKKLVAINEKKVDFFLVHLTKKSSTKGKVWAGCTVVSFVQIDEKL